MIAIFMLIGGICVFVFVIGVIVGCFIERENINSK